LAGWFSGIQKIAWLEDVIERRNIHRRDANRNIHHRTQITPFDHGFEGQGAVKGYIDVSLDLFMLPGQHNVELPIHVFRQHDCNLPHAHTTRHNDCNFVCFARGGVKSPRNWYASFPSSKDYAFRLLTSQLLALP
jgi:hypothetical protein